MKMDFGPKLAAITKTLKESVKAGDLGAVAAGVSALEQLAGEVGAGQPQPHDPYLEENLWEAAQELVEAGQLEIIRQEGEEAVWKLTPEAKLTAQLEELIGTERLERLHHLAESEGDKGGYVQLHQEIMDDLEFLFTWLAEHGFLQVREHQGKLVLFVWAKIGTAE